MRQCVRSIRSASSRVEPCGPRESHQNPKAGKLQPEVGRVDQSNHSRSPRRIARRTRGRRTAARTKQGTGGEERTSDSLHSRDISGRATQRQRQLEQREIGLLADALRHDTFDPRLDQGLAKFRCSWPRSGYSRTADSSPLALALAAACSRRHSTRARPSSSFFGRHKQPSAASPSPPAGDGETLAISCHSNLACWMSASASSRSPDSLPVWFVLHL
jgi:hypothetical protein